MTHFEVRKGLGMAATRKLDETEVQLAIVDLQGRMTLVEKGVSNFREFQQDARDFFTAHNAREEAKERIDKRRATIHYCLLTGLIALIVGCAVTLFTWVINGHHAVVQTTSTTQTATDASNPDLQ